MPSLGTAFFKIVCKGIAFADKMFNPKRTCIRRRTSDACSYGCGVLIAPAFRKRRYTEQLHSS